MKTITKMINELIKTNESPIPLHIIPNHMGINLCSVESLTWTKDDDGQLINVSINFNPSYPDESVETLETLESVETLETLESVETIESDEILEAVESDGKIVADVRKRIELHQVPDSYKLIKDWINDNIKYENRTELIMDGNDLKINLYTDTRKYSIVCDNTNPDGTSYMGCIMTNRRSLLDESWSRGADLPDGKYCIETLNKISGAIIRNELNRLDWKA